jgi:hypothetical protein
VLDEFIEGFNEMEKIIWESFNDKFDQICFIWKILFDNFELEFLK